MRVEDVKVIGCVDCNSNFIILDLWEDWDFIWDWEMVLIVKEGD